MIKRIKKEDLVIEINNNLSRLEIANKLGFNVSTITLAVKRFNLKIKKDNRGGLNKIVTNNPFEDLKDPETNYWLGYLAADGNLSSLKWVISLSQYNKDYHHVELFRDFVNKNLKLNQLKSGKGQSVNFGSKEVYKYLVDLGFSPRKALTFKYKGVITSDFVRGFFDGDGSCSQRRPKITTGSELFRDQIINYFNDKNIKCNYHIKGSNENCYDIYILKEGRKPFYELMYCNKGPFLQRKHDSLLATL